MSKSLKLVGLAVASAFALTACGGTQQSGQDAVPNIEPSDTQEHGYDSEPMDDDFHPADLSGTTGHGVYKLHSMTGAEIEFVLPTDSGDEAVQQIEEYRQAMHGDEVTYTVVDVDNRNGSDSVGVGLTVFDEGGNKYEFDSASSYVSSLEAEPIGSDGEQYELNDGTVIGWDEEFDLYNEGVELHNEHIGGIEVSERSETVLVYTGTDLPDEFTRVAVDVGYETEDAYLAD